ncbi:MAG: acetate--CoA ligase, partial [Acidobacteria bacterium]|nr:acetate--CoA ligase [Acidobacteriota bacterium]
MAKTPSGPRKEIDALLDERRTFVPPSTFSDVANVSDPGIYDRAGADPEAFWESFARELEWIEPWSKVLEWNPPNAKWFVGGKINASVNCIDRHVRTARRNKAALIWEGEPGDRRTLTYFDLYREVNAFGGVLKSLGVRRGDRVALYMPLVPELAIAMLACARIGAVHSVVFGGFSAESLRDRINDAEACVLVTADGGYRRGQVVPLKQMADDALRETPSINHVVVVRRQKHDPVPVTMQPDRDHWYHELMMKAPLVCDPEEMDAEDLLYILYTSGTTGKPKGIVHTTGGYLVGTYATTKWVFDLKEDDVYWCTADIGWVTGHSYLVYGPLANGATAVMYEGAPDWPAKDRLWEIIERYGVTIFYTAPTAIRAFMRWGTDWPAKRDLSSLRLLGSVGEPINPEAWMWYYEYIGRRHCPVVDTWWQTETGAILITPLPGLTTLKPGSASRPFPGITAEIRTADGQVVTEGGGLLAITKPWPSMLRGIYGDPDRFVQQYWSQWSDGMYFTGDGAKLDADGYFWLLGRVDDVLNVAGHRIGTMEVESALVDHSAVAEAAVVGRTHEIKGQAIAAFVTIREGVSSSDELIENLKSHVVKKIGAIAKPDVIL